VLEKRLETRAVLDALSLAFCLSYGSPIFAPSASTPESFARTKIAFPVVRISMPPLGERGPSSTKTSSIAILESRLRGDFEEYCAASGNVAEKLRVDHLGGEDIDYAEYAGRLTSG
jgi:hypothetical protein